MPYYQLTAPDNGENIMMKRVSNTEIHTTAGITIDKSALSLPVNIDMYVDDDYGYDQYDPDFEGEVEELSLEERLLDYYDLPCLMTPKLVDLLTQSGVDNIQIFPVNITNVNTGEPLDHEYLFVNLVGLESCADLDNSEKSPIGDRFHFHKLVIKPNSQLTLPIIRLAESPSVILVNETIANAIKASDLKGIDVAEVPYSKF